MGLADGVYRFGVKDTELRDEQALIGTLGHEVAHAYRTHHGLVVASRDTEEQLTDLTTIYLGFGVFTLESSHQFKTGLGFSAFGAWLGYERPMPTCSSCGHTVAVDAARCRYCEVALAGGIKTKLDLFEAEERYRDAERQSLAEARQAATSSAKQRCPRCQWTPMPSDIWACTCGHHWNTFKTKGRCPDCDKLWDTTWCQQGKKSSPHAEWYR